MRRVISILLLCCVFVIIPQAVLSQSPTPSCNTANYDGTNLNVENSLNCTNESIYPEGLDPEATGILSSLCGKRLGDIFSLLGDQFMSCEGKKTRDMFIPAELKGDVELSLEELKTLEYALTELDGAVAGTDSAQVLGLFDGLSITDWLCKLYNRASSSDSKSGWTTMHEPAGEDFTEGPGSCPFNSTKNDSGGMLWPEGGPDVEHPEPSPSDTLPNPVGGVCGFGTGKCSVENLKKYFKTELGAQQASVICHRESGSNPFASNKTCEKPGGTLDYSIGLFQINMLVHCSSEMLKKYYPGGYTGPAFNARDVFLYNGNRPAFPPCQMRDQQKLDMCEEAMLIAENNIDWALGKSSDAQNWTAWSAAKVCGVVGGQPLPPRGPSFDQPDPKYESCGADSERVYVPGTTYQHLNQRHSCVVPQMFVVHWSGSWTTAQDTFNTLNTNNRSCQLAIDENTSLQMLDFYRTSIQKGWCAGGIWNDLSINFEISGVYFDEVMINKGDPARVTLNPDHPRYGKLKAETDKSIALACFAVQYYNIGKWMVGGHYEIQVGKSDPGHQYLAYFKRRMNEECQGPEASPTPVGGSQVSASEIRQGGRRIADGIYAKCVDGSVSGRVTRTNRQCIDDVAPPFRQDAVTIWKNNAFNEKVLQCVGLVHGAKAEIENETISGQTYAIDYWDKGISGYRRLAVGEGTPRPGDLLIWDFAPAGHIAYIIDVLDYDTVYVLEANFDFAGGVRVRQVNLDEPHVVGWITPTG